MFPIHPGRNLALELEARQITANRLSVAIKVPASRIDQIVKGKRSISAETAIRLGRYFGTGAQIWVNLQANYDLAKAEQKLGDKIAKEVEKAA